MKPIVIAGFDDERTKIPFTIPVKGRKPATVKIPRFDYLPEETVDALMADLEASDAEHQIIAVANALAAVPAGTTVKFDTLIEAAAAKLKAAGARITRIAVKGVGGEEITADQAALDNLAEYSARPVLPLRKREREIALIMLKHVLDEQQFGWFSALPSGALGQIVDAWKTQSAVSLGESGASENSSTSTEAPSTTTSSPTSDAADTTSADT